jgi:hypothetical protein
VLDLVSEALPLVPWIPWVDPAWVVVWVEWVGVRWVGLAPWEWVGQALWVLALLAVWVPLVALVAAFWLGGRQPHPVQARLLWVLC